MPSEWAVGIESARLPTVFTIDSWREFGLGQTGKLDQANGRTKDTLHIMKRCEELRAKAAQRKKFLGIF